jgi:hypothetical protein
MLPADDFLPIVPGAALHKLRAGETLHGYHIRGTIDLQELADEAMHFPVPLTLQHCRLDHLDAVMVQFRRPVVLRHVRIGRADFSFAYFLQGLLLEDCIVDSYLDFQAGGHNQPGFPLQLRRNSFHGFVNFFDCWYRGPVQVEDNRFAQGTNLLGQPENYPVTFDVPLLIAGNVGRLDHDDEGPKQPD